MTFEEYLKYKYPRRRSIISIFTKAELITEQLEYDRIREGDIPDYKKEFEKIYYSESKDEVWKWIIDNFIPKRVADYHNKS